MKKSRYTEEQIAFALKQAETGTTGLRGSAAHGDLGADLLSLEEALRRARDGRAAACLKQLEDENRKLKQLVADLSLDKHILQDVLSKKL